MHKEGLHWPKRAQLSSAYFALFNIVMRPQLKYSVSFSACYFKRRVDNLRQTQWRATKWVAESGSRQPGEGNIKGKGVQFATIHNLMGRDVYRSWSQTLLRRVKQAMGTSCSAAEGKISSFVGVVQHWNKCPERQCDHCPRLKPTGTRELPQVTSSSFEVSRAMSRRLGQRLPEVPSSPIYLMVL